MDKVGIDAAGTTKEVAQLALELVRGGLTIAQVNDSLSSIVRGAEATSTGFAQMGQNVTAAMKIFSLPASEAARVVDALSQGANSSASSVEGLGNGLAYAGPVAKQLGMDVEGTVAILGLLTNAGIDASSAGVTLRNGLTQLSTAAPVTGGRFRELTGQAKIASETMKRLGIDIFDASGKLLPTETVLLRLKAAFDQLEPASRMQIASNMFGGADDGSRWLALLGQSTADITRMTSAMQNTKGATDAARQEMTGMGLELRQLQGTMDSLGTTIGGVMAAGLRPLVGLANAAAGAVSGLPAPVKTTGAALIGLGLAATGASVGIGALNLVVAQVGGYAALRASIAGVAAVITGPLGSGLVILLGVVAALGVVSGAFRETDQTTKTLIQTAVGLGTFVAVLKGITAAQVAWNNATKAGAALQAFLVALTPGGIGRIALAAGAATAAYLLMGQAIGVAGQDTAELSDKARGLKDQIKTLQDQIAEQKRLGLDTTSAEKQLASLQLELQAIEAPLDIKLNIQKAQGEIKALKEQLSKLGDGDSGKAALSAQIEGLKQFQALLKAIDSGKGLENFSRPFQAAAKELQSINAQILSLTRQKNLLPENAIQEINAIDKKISNLYQLVEKKKLLLRVNLEEKSLREALQKINDATKGTQYNGEEAKLQIALAQVLEQKRNLSNDILQIGKEEVNTARSRLQSAKEELEAKKGALELESAQLSASNEQLGLMGKRIAMQQELGAALQNLVKAQADYMQSGFELEKARLTLRLNAEQQVLEAMIKGGATQEAIYNQMTLIAELKSREIQLEVQSSRDRIETLAKTFEMERQVLALKQEGQRLEQEARVNQAQMNALEQESKLIELRAKLAEANNSPAERERLEALISANERRLEIANEITNSESIRLKNLDVIFGLEKETMSVTQQTQANKERTAAAQSGYEKQLENSLTLLDKSAQGFAGAQGSFDNLKKAVADGSQPIEKIYETTDNLPSPLESARRGAVELTREFYRADDAARTLLDTLIKLSKAPAARWAGGGVEPGSSYQVNELGTESFLSRSGALSLIHAPAYGSWSPPSAGMVLPAGLTARLGAMGAFDGGGGLAAPRLAGIAPSLSSGAGKQVAALGRLQRSIDRLEGTMRSYNPTVTVNLPNNAGLLHTLQSFR
ncbi:MAG: phage tail tape measure protein [Cyanobacteria bacterium REEB417]|nr:phage tail tape measure protein [Cyanobacteria bacterium REEB417]